MTIYLYVKEHSKTKLKYFGKTIQNPETYKGSGTRWLNHIRKHGLQYVETLSVWSFEDQTECTTFALNFSKENDIVKSKEWANLREENALDGGFDHINNNIYLNEKRINAFHAKCCKPLELRHCIQCGNSFMVLPANKKRFCSKSCGALFNNKNRKNLRIHNTVCAYCNSPIYREN